MFHLSGLQREMKTLSLSSPDWTLVCGLQLETERNKEYYWAINIAYNLKYKPKIAHVLYITGQGATLQVMNELTLSMLWLVNLYCCC